MTQVGVKIPVSSESGEVGQIFTVARSVMPGSGCLWCNGLIDATGLQLEATGMEGKRARAYVGTDAPAPSVITLNGLAVSMGMTDLLLRITGLLAPADDPTVVSTYARYLPRSGRLFQDEPRRDKHCPHCGDDDDSLRCRGDDAILPVPLRRTTTDSGRRVHVSHSRGTP